MCYSSQTQTFSPTEHTRNQLATRASASVPAFSAVSELPPLLPRGPRSSAGAACRAFTWRTARAYNHVRVPVCWAAPRLLHHGLFFPSFSFLFFHFNNFCVISFCMCVHYGQVIHKILQTTFIKDKSYNFYMYRESYTKKLFLKLLEKSYT